LSIQILFSSRYSCKTTFMCRKLLAFGHERDKRSIFVHLKSEINDNSNYQD